MTQRKTAVLPIIVFLGLFLVSFQLESAVSPNTKNKQTIDLTIAGGILPGDGLGKQAADLMFTLADSFSISYLKTGRVDRNAVEQFPVRIRKIISTSGKKFPGKVLIQMDMLARPCNDILHHSYWHKFGLPETANDQIRFAYTMFESSRVPSFWVYLLNNFFDGAIVPDPFLIDVYKNSGVTVPIFYIPLGRDFSPFLKTPLKSSKNDPFTFANFNACIPRKNLVNLVRAFAEAFGNSPNVCLHLGWRAFNKNELNELNNAIKACNLTNVKIDDHALIFDDYLKRYSKVDCYVSPSTGEGFSITPREALCLGIPTIVTNNTGQTTICDSGLVRVIPSTIEIPAQYSFPGQFGVHYQCLQQDIVEALKDVYNNYDKYLSMAPKARKWAAQYHYPKMTSLYKTLIKPKKVILGEHNKILDDGTLMTTSKALLQKYKHLR